MEMIHLMFGIGEETIQWNPDIENVSSLVQWFFLHRYIKWTEQTFPEGGKKSNVKILLEQAVMKFTEVEKYHNDPRYVELWIKFVCDIFIIAPLTSHKTWYRLSLFDLFIFVSSGKKLCRTLRNLQVHASSWNRSETGILLHRLVWGIWESWQLPWSWPGLSRWTPEVCRATWKAATVSQVHNYSLKLAIYL